MTPAEAKIIIEIHDIDKLMFDPEEIRIMNNHNPELLKAYKSLFELSEKEGE